MEAHNGVPVNDLQVSTTLQHWIVLGPFPNDPPKVIVHGGNYRTGFHKDYLTPLGGEAHATITADTRLPTAAPGSQEATTALVSVTGSDPVDFMGLYGKGHQVAYAFCYVHARKHETVSCFLGSNDGAKVWIDSHPVHEFWRELGRPYTPRDDLFFAPLSEGLNPVLVKVEDGGGSKWEFGMEIIAEENRRLVDTSSLLQARTKVLAGMEFQAVGYPGHILPCGELPELGWKVPTLAANLIGDAPLTTQWFTETFESIHHATQPGLYVARVECMTPNGLRIDRILPFYCVEEAWRPNAQSLRHFADALPVPPAFQMIDFGTHQALNARIDALCNANKSPCRTFTDCYDALFLAAHARWLLQQSQPTLDDTIEIYAGDLAVRADQALRAYPSPPTPLRPITQVTPPGRELREGTPREAGMADNTALRLTQTCSDWYEATQISFTSLVARHGVVVYHETFGDSDEAQWHWWASITKAITGLLFAQFIDEGVVTPDMPIGQWLPDFPTQGPPAITFRHLFTHTTGLTGHFENWGLYNPRLDNVIACRLEALTPGHVDIYNGMGYDLVGRILEVITGTGIVRLFNERLFAPLKLTPPALCDLGGGLFGRCPDLARLAQLIANKGTYGRHRFFSAETFDQLMPHPLADFDPELNGERGIGLWWMREPRQLGVDDNTFILGQNTIGHGAASGSILRVDLDNDLIMVQTRNEAGPDYDNHAHAFFEAIAQSLR